MNSYDPDTSPGPTDWLQTDEGERIGLVSAYHQRKKIRLPNAQLHAVIHVVVENQLALERKWSSRRWPVFKGRVSVGTTLFTPSGQYSPRTCTN